MTIAEQLRKEGIEEGIRKDIQEILNEQLGNVPQDLNDKLADIHNVDALRRLLRAALHAESADDFRRHLRGI